MRSPATYLMATLRTLSFGAMVSCCVFGLLLQSSRVLCVGEDGHRQLEAAIRSCCAQPEGIPASVSLEIVRLASPKGESGHCGSCVDIPLVSNSFTSTQSVRVAAPHFLPQSVLLFILPISTSAYESLCHPVPFAEVSHSVTALRSLRTTVILV